MSDVSSIGGRISNGVYDRGLAAVNGRLGQDRNRAGVRRDADRVDLSETARFLTRLNELPDVREGLVERIKAEIAAGTYESDEKIDAAIEKLYEDL